MEKIGDLVTYIATNFLMIFQVLSVINPAVHFHAPNGQQSGVAINVKGFLQLLDKYGHEHMSEKALRASLDDSCMKKKGKQHFLINEAVGSATAISRGSNSECKVCICVPNKQVPKDFFDFFTGGTAIIAILLCSF